MNAKEILEFCAGLVADPGNGWSIGTLGVSGEFMRTDDEPVRHLEAVDSLAVATSKGALRIRPAGEVRIIAYDTLGSDGETWGMASHSAPLPGPMRRRRSPTWAKTGMRCARRTAARRCSTLASAPASSAWRYARATPV
jgi:hypothetical protein